MAHERSRANGATSPRVYPGTRSSRGRDEQNTKVLIHPTSTGLGWKATHL